MLNKKTVNNRYVASFFWHHIKPYKWYYCLMLLAPILGSFYSLAFNYATKLFLDIMESNQFDSYQSVLTPISIFFFAEFLLNVIWRISNFAEWRAEPYVRQSIVLESYDYVQHHSFLFFQNNFGGAINSRLKGILDGYDKFWAEMHHGLFFKIVKITVNLIALMLVNLYLGLFICLWVTIYSPIMYFLSEYLNVLTELSTNSKHVLFGKISDNITNIISLFSFSARNRELNSLDIYVRNDFIPKQIAVYKQSFWLNIVGGVLYIFMFVFIWFYMVHLRILGLISLGSFAFVSGIVLIISEDIWSVTTSLQSFAGAMGEWKSSLSILAVPQEGLDVPEAYPLVVVHPTIEFRDVTFQYDAHTDIFNDFNLYIKAGEKVGIVGHSGAGKSSLINLLLRYFAVTSGTILIDNQPIDLVTQDSLRSQIAIIPQDTMLFHRTILENIQFGNPQASYEQVIDASKKAHIHDLIMTLPEQYNMYVGERGIKLSGGQRQRIAIARAILKNVPILMLDEATSALDSQTEALIQESLSFFIEDKQKTVIAIAHRLSTLKHMDTIIVLDKGVIAQQGTHDELMQEPDSLYRKLWEYQEV